MGLDTVELVMEVEDRFRVALPDTECGRVRTVADLAALVISKLPRAGEHVCPTAHAFYQLRAQFVHHAAAARRLVRPGVLLSDLLPERHLRKRVWNAMRRENRRLPRLTFSSAWDQTMLWGSGVLFFVIILFIGATCGAMLEWGFWRVVPAALVVLLVGVVGYIRLYQRFETEFPAGIETVADLARVVAPLELPMSRAGERLIAEQRVLEEIRRITAGQIGLPLEKVTPESDFIKDLDMG